MRKFIVLLLVVLLASCSYNQTNAKNTDKQVKYIVEVEFPVGTVKEYKAVDYLRVSSGFIKLILEDGTTLRVNEGRVIIHEIARD